MAQMSGFTCDSCGKLMRPQERTKVTVAYEGETVDGQYSMDKCPDCVVVPEGVTLKPRRRRRRTVSDPAPQ